MTVKTWKFPGMYDADPELVADELERLGEDITPEQIVEAAREEGSELHKCFTWDDTEAAAKWRKQEARQLLHFLVIREVPDEEEAEQKPPVRCFYKTDNGGYKTAEKVFRHDDEYQKLLQRALAELHAFKVKYASLKELDYILDLID